MVGERAVKTFYESEIALLEHRLVNECHPMELDMKDENWMYYFAGIHDMAEKIMEYIRDKEAM